MKFAHLVFYIFVSSLIIFFCKNAHSWDIVCHSVPDEQWTIMISTPRLAVHLEGKLDNGKTRTVVIPDIFNMSEVTDYAKYTDGKHTMTYALKCKHL